MPRAYIKSLYALLLPLLIAALACTLTDASLVTPTPNLLPTQPPVTIIVPTSTLPPATATPAPTATSRPIVQLPPTSCAPAVNLPTYVVAVGDTLNTIAQRAGTTAAELARLNCLADVNLIRVGQQLFVPRAVITPAPVTPTPIVGGSVQVSPVLRSENGGFVVTGGSTVSLAWTPVVGLAGRIRFFAVASGSSTGQLLGTDDNAADGGRINWIVPTGFVGFLSAQAFAPGSEQLLARTVQDTFVFVDSTSAQRISINAPAAGATVTGSTVAASGTAAGLFENTFLLELRASGPGTLLSSQVVTYTSPDVGQQGNWSAALSTAAYTGPAQLRAIYTRPSDGAQVVLATTNLQIQPTPVRINSLTASPNPVTAGATATVSWNVSGVSTVSIRVVEADGRFGPWFNDQPAVGSLTYTVPASSSPRVTFLIVPLPEQPGGPTQQVTLDVLLPPSP